MDVKYYSCWRIPDLKCASDSALMLTLYALQMLVLYTQLYSPFKAAQLYIEHTHIIIIIIIIIIIAVSMWTFGFYSHL